MEKSLSSIKLSRKKDSIGINVIFYLVNKKILLSLNDIAFVENITLNMHIYIFKQIYGFLDKVTINIKDNF